MTATNPTITLNNGTKMPALGLGVYQSSPEETATVVSTALQTGYRLIDTAAAYQNEKQVGEGIRNSGINRSEIFITTKLWMSDYGHERAMHGFDRSMKKLGLEYLDLYLLHWPVPKNFEPTVASYKAAAKILSEGRVRAIGVSNHSPRHLQNLVDRTNIVPAVNQVELHPFFIQKELREAHAKLGVVTQAWSPIGGVNRYWVPEGRAAQDPLSAPTVMELGRRHRKTPAQIILRWHLQHGISPIPKTVRAERIRENFDVFDFELNKQEVAEIDALDMGKWFGPDPEMVSPEMFNFKIED
jgi:diketogulonate reductase-like aldo/keto reductase